MKERPIIFSGHSVNAILAGRKTQTRRVVKPQPPDGYVSMVRDCDCGGNWWFSNMPPQRGAFSVGEHAKWDNVFPRCPYGAPGDRLWVRETWVELLHTSPATDAPLLCPGDKLIEHATRTPEGRWHYDGRVIAYRATSTVEFCDGDGFTGEFANKDDMPRWRSPIHMPRWASRITLELTDIRVERLQQISEQDAQAEGVEMCAHFAKAQYGHPLQPHRTAFAWLWALIHGRGSWCTNPWVWVIEFKRVEP